MDDVQFVEGGVYEIQVSYIDAQVSRGFPGNPG